jgi:NADPH:quinone reductase
MKAALSAAWVGFFDFGIDPPQVRDSQRLLTSRSLTYTLCMKALVITSLSGPDALAIQDVPEPTMKTGQTVVRVRAGGLNFADFMTAKGGYPGTPAPPLIAGREFSGVEENTGRRVMGYAQWSAFAEKTAAYSTLLWPVPDQWTDEQAAAFPVNYFTAYLAYWQAGMTGPSQKSAASQSMWGQPPSAVQRSEALQPALRVLIHAVAGGVGTAAVQIGHLLGVEMFGTSSSDEKLARVSRLGLQHGINYKQHDYEEVVKNLTHGEGVDAVFEMLGGEHTAKSLRCLRGFGRVIQYGTATGKPPQLDLRAMYAKSTSVQGLWLTYLSQKQEIMEPAWQQLSAWIGEGKLVPQIGHVFPFDRAIEAYKLLGEGKNYGKVVLKIG